MRGRREGWDRVASGERKALGWSGVEEVEGLG